MPRYNSAGLVLLWFASPALISHDADVSAGEIPASMGQLTNLTELYLEVNHLSGKNLRLLLRLVSE